MVIICFNVLILQKNFVSNKYFAVRDILKIDIKSSISVTTDIHPHCDVKCKGQFKQDNADEWHSSAHCSHVFRGFGNIASTFSYY